MQTIQKLAAHTLDTVLSGRNLTDTLAALWRQEPALTGPQRAAIMDICYGSLRHYGWLRGALDSLLSKPLADPFIDRLLIISLYQLLYSQTAAYAVVDHAVHVATAHDDGRLKALVNAILRNFQRRRAELTATLKRESVAFWNHPDWWIGVVRRTLTRKVIGGCWLATLTAADMPATLHTSGAITLTKPVPVDKLPGFAEGVVSVQDAGAQLAASWLEVKDGMRVLDACAAPGGKTGHLLEIADLDLTAVDVDTARLARVSSNLARLGLSAQTVTGDAARPATWWDGKPFDRVLADVPCSASGVVRRHPDIKWTRRPTDAQTFARQQIGFLDALWALVVPGGKMLYATCSIFPAENRRQIDNFLTRHVNASLERDIQLLPSEEHDGFYYALLCKA